MPTTEQKLQRIDNATLSKELECIAPAQKDEVSKNVVREAARRLRIPPRP